MPWDKHGQIHAQVSGKTITEVLCQDDTLFLTPDRGDTLGVRFDEQFGPFWDAGALVKPGHAHPHPQLTRHIKGRTIKMALTDGAHLILRTWEGENIRIKWLPATGKPDFDGQHVSIQIRMPVSQGIAF